MRLKNLSAGFKRITPERQYYNFIRDNEFRKITPSRNALRLAIIELAVKLKL